MTLVWSLTEIEEFEDTRDISSDIALRIVAKAFRAFVQVSEVQLNPVEAKWRRDGIRKCVGYLANVFSMGPKLFLSIPLLTAECSLSYIARAAAKDKSWNKYTRSVLVGISSLPL
jgi:hypothetical protein